MVNLFLLTPNTISLIGFEIFRFEDDQTVEDWDNIQPRLGPNFSGRSMVDGANEVQDIEKTDTNRDRIKQFVEYILIKRQLDHFAHYVHPDLSDGRDSLLKSLQEIQEDSTYKIIYSSCHRILAEGNFILSVCEGFRSGIHSSFYDLFRLVDDCIHEHWCTIEPVPPRSEWKNQNGKF